MIYYKTDEEIELLRLSNMLVGRTHGEMAKLIKPGVSTSKLDAIAESFIRDNGGKPGFLGYNGFPNTLCISINDAVVHGIPSEKIVLKDGDIVSVDCGVFMNGYYGDSAYTYTVGEVDEKIVKLLQVTKESLYKGIEKAIIGNRLGDISYAVQQHAETNGFTVVREMVGHGVGRNLHEDPEVPNYGKRGRGVILKKGLVIAIEPMINIGKRDIYQENDGWTIKTKDGLPSAHFEHTIAIGEKGADILSSFKYVEDVLNEK
ncbi:MAG: type I methionyl aminopeptidase [Bacteroidales bacterium]|nr:type I methionyl aminopeptidase [Bacteroidales bacterium]MBN2757375.1 type I methionyl aminopeptidase [Bacteroidales bacterium]